MIVIKVFQKRATPAVYQVGHLPCRIGRAIDNHIVINDDSVSAYHAEVSLEDEAYVLRDLESTNGTIADGKKIDELEIIGSAEAFIGETKLIIVDKRRQDFLEKTRILNIEKIFKTQKAPSAGLLMQRTGPFMLPVLFYLMAVLQFYLHKAAGPAHTPLWETLGLSVLAIAFALGVYLVSALRKGEFRFSSAFTYSALFLVLNQLTEIVAGPFLYLTGIDFPLKSSLQFFIFFLFVLLAARAFWRVQRMKSAVLIAAGTTGLVLAINFGDPSKQKHGLRAAGPLTYPFKNHATSPKRTSDLIPLLQQSAREIQKWRTEIKKKED